MGIETINGSLVLLLVYVDNDWKDIGGNIFPQEGYIEAKEFTADIDIRFGLCGILWGETTSFPYERMDSGHWLVVKTESNAELIRTDCHLNRYKFRNGSVVFCGSLKSARKYIKKHRTG